MIIVPMKIMQISQIIAAVNGIICDVQMTSMASSKLINAVLELTYMIKWNGDGGGLENFTSSVTVDLFLV